MEKSVLLAALMCTTNNPVKFKRKDLKQLIQEKNTSGSHKKPKGSTKRSKYGSDCSQIYINDVKQDFIIYDSCQLILAYKVTTGYGCMSAHSHL